ncbi:hypothetical protein ASD24_23705 [Paenibacillus sp. Root52]|nr:hypothetical protein ASD24_23705 [Paenibacillus sp. Root52]
MWEAPAGIGRLPILRVLFCRFSRFIPGIYRLNVNLFHSTYIAEITQKCVFKKDGFQYREDGMKIEME